MKSNNYGQVHTNHISTSDTITPTLEIKPSRWEKVKSLLAPIKPYAKGVLFGLWWIFIGAGIGLFFVASALEGKCDGYGDRLGYAADVRDYKCHLKVNGEWKPLDSLTLTIKE